MDKTEIIYEDSLSIDRRCKQAKVDRLQKKRAARRRKRIRNKVVAFLLTAAVATVSAGWVYTASAKEVTITEINEFTGTNESIVVKTRVKSVGELLDSNGVSLGDADKLSVSPDTELSSGNEIVVKRGKQVTIKTNEGESVANVTTIDAEDALAEAGIKTGLADEITSDGSVISIVTVEKDTVTDETPIEFTTEYRDDPTMTKGTTKVLTQGENGILATTKRVTYRDGVPESSTIVKEEVLKEPVTQVVARGSKPETTVKPPETKGANSSTDTGNTINGMKYSKKITMTATAYSTSPSENGGYTVSAKGNPLHHGIVAIDPNVVPLGSRVYVESTDGSWVYGVASAEDTGGAIKGNRIDLCYEGSVASVNTFGRRSCNVYILE